MNKTIVLTGGGSAGHVTPNINLIPYINSFFDKVIYIGSENGIERELTSALPLEYYPIPTAKLKRSLALSNLLIPYKLYLGYREAKKILQNTKANVVFSKGGYVSVPVALACGRLHIPLIIHESDLSIGLANKIAKRFAKHVFTTYRETASNLTNGMFVGAPINKNQPNEQTIKRVKNMYNIGIMPVCLVVGGSLGAKTLNEIVWKNLDSLTKNYHILHLTGKGKSNPNIKHSNYTQIEYTPYMNEILSFTDIAITRGGSNMIFELLNANVPMLIIPLEKGSRGDQIANADYFTRKGYALTLREKNLDKFLDTFSSLTSRSKFMRFNNRHVFPKNALEKIANTLIECGK